MSTQQMPDAADQLGLLQARLDMIEGQRLADLERLRSLARNCDRLRYDLAEREAELAGRATNASLAKGPPASVEPFQLLPAAVRAGLRKEKRAQPTLASKIASSLMLRFARAAAARRDYARAEAFYQVILMLAPRAFVWRQLGNMLAGQGLFVAAVECFEQAIAMNEQDAATWHAQAMSLRKLDRGDDAGKALARAIALDPSFAARNN